MLTVREAFIAARDWATGMHADAELNELRLEEVELSDDERTWHITLGWLEPAVRESALSAALSRNVPAPPRVYKTVDVDAASGVVKAVHLRVLAS